VVQQIRSVLSHCAEHLGDIALKQQQADCDGWYAVPYLANGTNADRPSGFGKSDLGPAQFNIDDVVAIGVDGADGRNFLPLDIPWHQSMIENSSRINREDDRISGSTPAETVHEKGHADQPRKAEPFHGRNGNGEAGCRWCCGAEKSKAGDADLGDAPPERGRASLANRLCSLDGIALD